MDEGDLERRDWQEIQKEFRDEAREHLAWIRNEISRIDDKLDALIERFAEQKGVLLQLDDLRGEVRKLGDRLAVLIEQFAERKGASKVRIAIYSAVGAAVLSAALAGLLLLLKD